jgi:hypothetical protein
MWRRVICGIVRSVSQQLVYRHYISNYTVLNPRKPKSYIPSHISFIPVFSKEYSVGLSWLSTVATNWNSCRKKARHLEILWRLILCYPQFVQQQNRHRPTQQLRMINSCFRTHSLLQNNRESQRNRRPNQITATYEKHQMTSGVFCVPGLKTVLRRCINNRIFSLEVIHQILNFTV